MDEKEDKVSATDENGKKLNALALPLPIRIMIGQTYKMVVDNHIASAKVEKIYDDNGDRQVIVTIKKKGHLFASTTSSLSTKEFKRRIISGGYMELEI